MILEDLKILKEKKTLSVSELTSQIKNLLENNFFDVYVTGEISNLSKPISGHIYFTLKDENASIRCVLFKFQQRLINFDYNDGDKVIIRGRITVYEKRGEYQIIVDYIEPDGIGALYLKFEKLKRKLEKEGLFDKKYKKKIPEFPRKIGIITSPTGAAIRDILNILKRRFVNINVIIAPVKVQGEEAKFEIVEAINFFNLNFSDIDVIILARGGGSLEDLQPFNEEIVARAIFNSNISIISAVGHETDFTIADFTADLRAPTPSAAAELVVKNKEDILLHLTNLEKQLISNMQKILNYNKQKFLNLEKRIYSKLVDLKSLKSRIQNYENQLISMIFNNFNRKKSQFLDINEHLKMQNPLLKIQNLRNQVNILMNTLENVYLNKIFSKKQKLNNLENSLKNLSPLNVLARGYSIVFKSNKVVNNVNQINLDDKINVLLYKGNFGAKVIEIGGEK